MKNGHIHTPYCPHGTADKLESYVEKAIDLGFTEISFTEHAPLPEGFFDTAPKQDSAMPLEKLEDYFQDIERIKMIYQDKITIHIGLEVDFIEGYEDKTKEFLNKYGKKLDDAILSVHFLKFEEEYDCLDYSPEVFGNMIQKYGSAERVYKKYYDTLLKAVKADLGPYKPTRIGHITLVRKFQKKYPVKREFRKEILEVLQAIKQAKYEIDYNGAGIAKPLCGEPYPPAWVVSEAKKLNIPLVYGSDAHQIKELSQGLEEVEKNMLKV